MSEVQVHFDHHVYFINKQDFEKKSSYKCFNDEIFLPKELDELVPLNEKIVHNFVDYFKGNGILISIYNVVALSMLADIYKTPKLKIFINAYKDLHAIEIVQNYFSEYDGKCNSEYEDLIGSVLNHFLDEPKLSEIPIIHLQAIIRKYTNSHSYDIPLLDFIFKYIETHTPGTFLLRLIPLIKDEDYFLKQIYERTNTEKTLALLQTSHYSYLYQKNIEYKELINSINKLVNK